MPPLRLIGLCLVTASLSACQLNSFTSTKDATPPSERMQGTLVSSEGQWLFQPCGTEQTYSVNASNNLKQELTTLAAEAPHGVFADIQGVIDEAQQRFTPTLRYRLQIEGQACNDPDLARLQLRASGNEPFWSILQTPRGLILNQADQASIALPYIEEELGDDRFYLSSEANEHNLKLWITPKQCIDSMSGTVYHLHAKLQWNQETLTGCAAFGGLRNSTQVQNSAQ